VSTQTSLSRLSLALEPPSPARRERDSFRVTPMRAMHDAGAGRGSGFGQHRGNRSENCVQIVEHISIAKPQHRVPQASQFLIPECIVNLRVGCVVNSTIKLDNHLSARAAKIDDVTPNRFLTLELPPFDRVPSQLEPQPFLGWRWGLPMISSQLRQISPGHTAIVPTSLSRATGEGQLPRSGSRERVGV
jgi:hypothetical protein